MSTQQVLLSDGKGNDYMFSRNLEQRKAELENFLEVEERAVRDSPTREEAQSHQDRANFFRDQYEYTKREIAKQPKKEGPGIGD